MAIVPGQGYLDPNLWVTADFTSGENILPVIIIDPDTGDPIIPGGGGGNTFNNGIGDIGGGVIGLGGNPIIQTTLVVPDIPNTHNIFFGQQPASLFDNIGFAANQNIQFNTGTLGVTDFTTSTISQNSINFGLFNFPFFQGITLQMSTLSGILLQDDIFQKGMEGATLFNVDWVNDDNYYAQVGLIKQRIGNQLIDATVLNPGAAEDLQFIQWDNGSGLFVMAPGGGGGSGIDIENDGLALGSFTTINGIGGGFVDAGGGVADYTPPAGSVPGGAPVDVTKSAAQAGVSAAYSREDHKHDIATASGVTVGSANTEGSSTSLARADHTHIVGSFVDQAGVGTTLTLGIINDGEALIRSGASIISTAIPALQDLQSVITQGSVADLTAATDLVISDSSSDSIFTIEETTGNVDINSTSSYSINGKSALRVIGTSGGFPDSVVIAGNSADSLDTGSFNSVIIGEGILPGYSAVISDSVLIGNNIGFSTAQLPGETIALGSDVFPGLQGTLNSGQIGIGFDVGRFITSANSNTLVGNRVRDLTATSSGNSVFGYDACGLATSAAARITATNTSIFGRQLAGNTSNGSRAFTNCAFFGAQGMTNDSITVSDTISIGINNNVTAATSTDNSMLFGSDIIVDGHNNVKIFAHTATSTSDNQVLFGGTLDPVTSFIIDTGSGTKDVVTFDEQLGGQDLNPLVTSPGASEDGFQVVWDNGLGEYTLGQPDPTSYSFQFGQGGGLSTGDIINPPVDGSVLNDIGISIPVDMEIIDISIVFGLTQISVAGDVPVFVRELATSGSGVGSPITSVAGNLERTVTCNIGTGTTYYRTFTDTGISGTTLTAGNMLFIAIGTITTTGTINDITIKIRCQQV